MVKDGRKTKKTNKVKSFISAAVHLPSGTRTDAELNDGISITNTEDSKNNDPPQENENNVTEAPDPEANHNHPDGEADPSQSQLEKTHTAGDLNLTEETNLPVPDGPVPLPYDKEKAIQLWKCVFEMENRRKSFFEDLLEKGYIADSFEVMKTGPNEPTEHFVLAEGEDFSNKANYGRLVFKTKNVYMGNLKNWYFHGHGRYAWTDGTIYEGDMVQGVPQGNGTIFWPDGAVYEGQFQNGALLSGGNFFATAEEYTVRQQQSPPPPPTSLMTFDEEMEGEEKGSLRGSEDEAEQVDEDIEDGDEALDSVTYDIESNEEEVNLDTEDEMFLTTALAMGKQQPSTALIAGEDQTERSKSTMTLLSASATKLGKVASTLVIADKVRSNLSKATNSSRQGDNPRPRKSISASQTRIPKPQRASQLSSPTKEQKATKK